MLLILEEVKSYWRDTFRPALILLSCEDVGVQSRIVEDAGLVFSFIAAGAGIHDDIIDKSLKNLSVPLENKKLTQNMLIILIIGKKMVDFLANISNQFRE